MTRQLIGPRFVLRPQRRTTTAVRHSSHNDFTARCVSCCARRRAPIAGSSPRPSAFRGSSIVEKLQRVDLTPLEEARAYQERIGKTGCTVDELAERIGIKQPWRITERLSLLKLRGEYQDFLEKGLLTHAQAYEMSRLDPPDQDTLLRLIQAGKCDSYDRLWATAEGLVQRERQSGTHARTGSAPSPPSHSEIN